MLGGEGAQNDKRQNYTDTQKEKTLSEVLLITWVFSLFNRKMLENNNEKSKGDWKSLPFLTDISPTISL